MNQLKSLIKEVERLKLKVGSDLFKSNHYSDWKEYSRKLQGIKQTVEVVDNDFDLMGEGFDEHKEDWQTLKKLLGIK